MDNVLIDDRRIHVDFSQSVSKMQGNKWVKNSKMIFSSVMYGSARSAILYYLNCLGNRRHVYYLLLCAIHNCSSSGSFSSQLLGGI